MDKLIHDGRKATISNDGAELMKLLDIVHPAASVMVDIAKSQDAMVGDGTTTVVLLACEFMKMAKPFIEDGMHSMIVIRGFREACRLAVEKVNELCVGADDIVEKDRRVLLERCAGTALNSKLISGHKKFFAPMVVDAVTSLGGDLNLDMVGVKKVGGGSVTESFLVHGVAFKKTFSYAGFEQQPKKFKDPVILCLNVELELKSEKENAEVRIDDPDKYQSIVDAEWRIIFEKLEMCVESGANVILSRLPIGDLATQYFADRKLFCAGRVSDADMRRVSSATGAKVQTSVFGFTDDVLGHCGLFEEKQVGGERYNLFTGCPGAKTSTIVLRGGSEQFIEESHRSIHDAIMVVKRTVQSSTIVAGGGAIEMEISKHIKDIAMETEGKLQLVLLAFSRALEIIPRQLCDNAGFDSTTVLNMLRKKHAEGDGMWYGVDIDDEGICDTFNKYVWEPAASKVNSISAATEAACLVLSVDETVKNPKSEGVKPPGGGGGGRGNPVSRAMGGQGMRGMMQSALAGGGRGSGYTAMKGRGGR